MKKFFFLLLTLISFNVENVFAQLTSQSFSNLDSTNSYQSKLLSQKNIISIHPFALIVGGLELGYERAILTNKSLKFIFGYYSATNPWPYTSYNVSSMEGFKTEIQYRAYLNHSSYDEPMSGIYIGAYCQYRQIDLKDYDDAIDNSTSSFSVSLARDVSARALFPGVQIGYQFLISDIIFCDLNLGGGIIKPLSNEIDSRKADLTIVNPYINGVFPRFNFAIGFPF